MNRDRLIRTPGKVYEELLMIQRSVYERECRRIPLWQCMEQRVVERQRWRDQDIFGLGRKKK